jgi:hypothetical protein
MGGPDGVIDVSHTGWEGNENSPQSRRKPGPIHQAAQRLNHGPAFAGTAEF